MLAELMLEERARAKINLHLHVVGKRPDGYHVLDSLVAFADAADVLRAEADQALSLSLTGPFAAALGDEPPEENLVLRAAAALRVASGTRRGARLTLDKRLPVASGIGGGSADAAAALRLLDRLWDCALPPSELARIALGLGADIPACLIGAPTRMGGIGELLGPAPALPECGIVLVNPGVALSTASVFRARDGGFSKPASLPPRWPDARAMAADLATLGNDLEAPALRLCPAVADTLAWLHARPACLLARMSGSGATCFGLFESEQAARAMAADAPAGWWLWTGRLAR